MIFFIIFAIGFVVGAIYVNIYQKNKQEKNRARKTIRDIKHHPDAKNNKKEWFA